MVRIHPPQLLSARPLQVRKSFTILPAAVLLLHALIALHAARHLSPTWDEIAYPAAGLAQIRTGQLKLNTVNPYLSKIIYAVPLLFTPVELPFNDPSWSTADEYRFGYAFTFHNVVDAKEIVFLSRVPVVVFSVLTGLLLYLWIASACGPIGGLLALMCYVTTPALLSRASVAQLEMPMYFFILSAIIAHERWFESNNRRYLQLSAILTGFGALCKLVVLPLIPTFVLLNLFFHPATPAMRQRWWSIASFLGLSGAVFLSGYLPWSGGVAALVKTARNLVTFDQILPYYWAGKTSENVSALVSWPAFFAKAPLHTLVAAAAGWWAWREGRARETARVHLAVFFAACLGSVLFFKHAVSTIQLSPAYLAVAGLAGGLAFSWKKGWGPRCAIVALFALGAADVFSVHPNYIAYFNPLAGGANRGYRWLADSDQDWGQSLPALAAFQRKEGNPPMVLCYSGSGDPVAYGISYQDLLSPALATRERKDFLYPDEDRPRYLAVGTKVLQSEPRFFSWLSTSMTPKTVVGQTFLVYDVSHNADAFGWMSEIYRFTGRPEQARKAALWEKQISASTDNPT